MVRWEESKGARVPGSRGVATANAARERGEQVEVAAGTGEHAADNTLLSLLVSRKIVQLALHLGE